MNCDFIDYNYKEFGELIFLSNEIFGGFYYFNFILKKGFFVLVGVIYL